MNSETLEFLKELYTGYKQYGYKFSLVYSTDQSEKLEQQKMLEYLEDNGYIILTSNSIGFRYRIYWLWTRLHRKFNLVLKLIRYEGHIKYDMTL
mgnify:CR=1 FL=1